MSWQCTAYVAGKRRCPDGAEITAAQKLLLMVLSNYHNPEDRAAWPSLPTLAEESLASITSAKRFLDYLEEHLMIERRDRTRKGRGSKNNYVFLELDDPKRLQQLLKERRARKETVQSEPFFSPEENGSQTVQKQPRNGPQTVQIDEENGPQTVQIDGANKELSVSDEPEPDPDPDQHAKIRAALKTWIEIKIGLRHRLDDGEWRLWVRPALLLKLMSGTQLLIALPSNGQIIQAAKGRMQLLWEMAHERGYGGVCFTRYPDDWEREQVRERYPEFYEQMLGNRAS